MPDSVRISFEPAGVTVQVPAGATVYEAAHAASLTVDAPCGGQGTCGKCRVVLSGTAVNAPTAPETEHLSTELLGKGMRLACQARVLADVTVTVPQPETMLVQKTIEADLIRSVPLDPNVRRYDLELTPPSLADQRSDFLRVAEAIGVTPSALTVSLGCLHELPAALRADEPRVAATAVGGRLVGVRAGSARGRCLGAAVDIGTSTVAVYLVDLESGALLCTAAAQNTQLPFGDDVIARISYANDRAGGLAVLRDKIVTLVNGLIAQAVGRVGGEPGDVYEVTVVGNTCMHHIFLGLNPRYLAASPYVPVTNAALDVPAVELGLAVHPSANVFCLPCIAGFVGADTVGVIVATELTRCGRPALAVDIGTNGELVLWSGDRLLTASCAAGPAFEGAHIQHGMRAASGAIDCVTVADGDLAVHTIGDQPARGLCGSGLFDAMAVVLELGLVDSSGRMADEARAADLPAGLVRRLQGEASGRQVILAEAGQSAEGTIVFTQGDVRELQLAKGAIRASIEMLLDYAGLAPADLAQILIAGAFGNFINPRSALRMGLLPEVPEDRIAGVGNAAGIGAILALISRQEREYSQQVARTAEHIELFRRAEFQMVFAEYMMF